MTVSAAREHWQGFAVVLRYEEQARMAESRINIEFGLVAQRLEQRTHNAHQGIPQQAASIRGIVQIANV